MNYFKEIAATHTVSADPIYCAMKDGHQTHHCKFELSSVCALFKTTLKQDNFWNMKCKECLAACALTVDAVPVVLSCAGCEWKGTRHQRCTCCARNKTMKDNYMAKMREGVGG